MRDSIQGIGWELHSDIKPSTCLHRGGDRKPGKVNFQRLKSLSCPQWVSTIRFLTEDRYTEGAAALHRSFLRTTIKPRYARSDLDAKGKPLRIIDYSMQTYNVAIRRP